MRGSAWSVEEVEATVRAYFEMLQKELRGEPFNKAEYNRSLERMLQGRSKQAIEFKHANISAVLVELRHPWINGYKPRGNYQELLAEAVVTRVNEDSGLRSIAVERVAAPPPPALSLPQLEDPPTLPTFQDAIREPKPLERWLRQARVIDYFEREARNRSLGDAGEELAEAIEKSRLQAAGHSDLADRVERVSKTRGDGAGFDLLSFETDGRERFIEVKTTSFAKETPFQVTISEVTFSSDFASQYHLYRLFTFREQPRMYKLEGSLERVTRLKANTFMAYPG